MQRCRDHRRVRGKVAVRMCEEAETCGGTETTEESEFGEEACAQSENSVRS